MRIGIIGLGHIGRRVALAVAGGEAGDATIGAGLVRTPANVAPEIRALGFPVHDRIAPFLAESLDLVVELGGHASLREYAEAVLASGRHLVTVSVGAFADDAFLARVRAAAAAANRQVLVPSGAIAGLEAISAAAMAPLDSVTHTTRKPPGAFTEAQLGGPAPTEPRLLYDGPAREGVGRYPENVNVAAAVSLAGIGLDRTRLRVFADPTINRNRHEVDVEGFFGTLRIEIENIPTDNPKTGRIVALSVTKAIRDLTAPIVLGR